MHQRLQLLQLDEGQRRNGDAKGGHQSQAVYGEVDVEEQCDRAQEVPEHFKGGLNWVNSSIGCCCI